MVKAARFLNQCRISQSKTVGGLSGVQRTELVGLLPPLTERAATVVPEPAADPGCSGAPRGRLLVVTGPSGAGKGTLMRRLVERPDAEVAVSATTEGERREGAGMSGAFFLPLGRGSTRVEREFLEWCTSGHRYGALNSELERMRTQGEPACSSSRRRGAAP